MKRVLMIAFQYPPYSGGSAIHRTLKFSRYLPNFGWQPIILTAHPRAYPRTGDDQLHEVPGNVPVTRAFALDTSRHLSIRGSYLRLMALPDRWVSWWLGAVPTGLFLFRKYRPQVIWSTYPIATAHLIGLTLHRLTGVPWVVDFMDSMTEEHYPHSVLTRGSYRWIEKQAVRYGTRLIFTAELTRQMYVKRYPHSPPEQCLLIPNGYDEEDFKEIIFSEPGQKSGNHPVRLLHAGLIYPEERDPRPFFRVLSRLKREGRVDARGLRVDLRAAGSEEYYSTLIRELGIDDLVHMLPPLPYRRALQDCAEADALLLLQGASCNHQIPAKTYEYLRLRKPILALTPDEGDTAALLREERGATIVDPADEQAIYRALPHFMNLARDGTHPMPDMTMTQRYTWNNQAQKLTQCLSQLIT